MRSGKIGKRRTYPVSRKTANCVTPICLARKIWISRFRQDLIRIVSWSIDDAHLARSVFRKIITANKLRVILIPLEDLVDIASSTDFRRNSDEKNLHSPKTRTKFRLSPRGR